MRDESKVVVVRRFSSWLEAELARSALEAYGIKAEAPDATWSRPYELLVSEKDVEAANDILGPEEPKTSRRS